MRIAFAADHAGRRLKNNLAERARAAGHEVLDLGTHDDGRVDYPDFGRACADALADGRAERGVVVCGTGLGIAMAANRVPGVRCAPIHDVTTARLARLHNDANMIALGERIIGASTAADCLDTFLATEFEGGRHGPRIAKLG